ncbi:MAG: NAD(P)/FAD-dependent oxidoreductase, partial [Acidimicrobiales bacterium]
FHLTRGLMGAVVKRGVRVHETSRVVSLGRAKDAVVVSTEFGSITAPNCVFALNAYSPLLGIGRNAILPTYTYVIATSPLSVDARELLGWHQRHRIVLDAGLNYYYMQLRPNGQFLMGGGGRPPVPRNPGTLPLHDAPHEYARIHREMLDRFPFLETAEIVTAWGGPLDLTESGFPIVARVTPGVFVNAGYNGRGLLMATLSGKALAGEVLGADTVEPADRRFADLILRRGVDRVEVNFDSAD